MLLFHIISKTIQSLLHRLCVVMWPFPRGLFHPCQAWINPNSYNIAYPVPLQHCQQFTNINQSFVGQGPLHYFQNNLTPDYQTVNLKSQQTVKSDYVHSFDVSKRPSTIADNRSHGIDSSKSQQMTSSDKSINNEFSSHNKNAQFSLGSSDQQTVPSMGDNKRSISDQISMIHDSNLQNPRSSAITPPYPLFCSPEFLALGQFQPSYDPNHSSVSFYDRFYALNPPYHTELDKFNEKTTSVSDSKDGDSSKPSNSTSLDLTEKGTDADCNRKEQQKSEDHQRGEKRTTDDLDQDDNDPAIKMSRYHHDGERPRGGRGHRGARHKTPSRGSECTRSWELVKSGPSYMGDRQRQRRASEMNGWLDFNVVSYNVLAQDLLEDNSYLYRHCQRKPHVLEWNYRWNNLLREFTAQNADIFCFQEVNEDHYKSHFLPELRRLGYYGIYKKRTGKKKDGCAVFFRQSLFTLESYELVEYCKGGLLDRDNVGVVALLKIREPVKKPDHLCNCLCVANTHLLFNPKRGDVKLAQLGVLFSAIDRLAYKKTYRYFGQPESQHWPIIVSGDMNLQPHSDIYDFMTEGRLNYDCLVVAQMSGQCQYGRQKTLGKGLFPKSLELTDNCQVISELTWRLSQRQKQYLKKQKKMAKRRAGRNNPSQDEDDSSQSDSSFDFKAKVKVTDTPHVRNETLRASPQRDRPSTSAHTRDDIEEISYTQNCGTLTHDLCLTSVYEHSRNNHGQMQDEITTFHSETACTVDYILYSVKCRSPDSRSDVEDRLRLISRLTLPTTREAQQIGHIPNDFLSSDHFPLQARFLYKLR